jgi:hypothetical protein
MLNVSRQSCVWSILLCLLAALPASTAKAQTDTVPLSPLDRQLSRIDLGIGGIGVFNFDTSGTVIINTQPTTLTLTPGNTAGALIQLRYIKSPRIGVEANFSYARYTQNYNTIGGVQQNAQEGTLGYVYHGPKFFGLDSFASLGGGAMIFHPTAGGGLSLQQQIRGAFYYSVGVETTVMSPHFGVRAQVRQVFFQAPDFYANYLATGARTSTFEPGFGFFLRF